ncbi:MAG: hypothetical protein UR93_C0019G0013 [Berkelbacteria bacterium GW2011_GWA2_35_9]|uniref:DUF86 domain-containing protein n=1 Tax=Berkelbacteria bacterium GW2011_GWA2_35_9 TaxID=1618333 RepID=A0A0G0D4K8_9BACT|nr:MAG: hypothetical protein UR93_C0019G0013 [Berkelbacteria bacterium GW2011_GWA2_35_9]
MSTDPNREIASHYEKLRTVERDFQLIVDTVIDINSHIIAANKLPISDDYQQTFTILAQNGFISPTLSEQIAPVTGLRNLIVHKYGEVDMERFFNALRKNTGQFNSYISEIEKLL